MSAFHSGWSARRLFAIPPTRPSWSPCTDDRKVTATMGSRRRTGATHINIARRSIRGKALDAESLPTSVRCFVASEADEASRNQRDALLALASWKSDVAFAGQASWRWRDTGLATIPEHQPYRDPLDRDLEGAFGHPVDLVVYLSKHRSEGRRPSLPLHPARHPPGARIRGPPETLGAAAP